MATQDWDVEKYRTDHESDEHWELRRNFMLAHQDKLSEDELVCMAQVFTNIEFMGCRYPDQTMMRVAELAKGVVEQFREKRKDSLKRTFVAASDAASAKVKGLHVDSTERRPKQLKKEDFGSISETAANSNKRETNLQAYSCRSGGTQSRENTATATTPSTQTRLLTEPPHIPQKLVPGKGPFAKFVILLPIKNAHPVSVLQHSSSVNKTPIRWDTMLVPSGQYCCKIFLNDQLIASGLDSTKKGSKQVASESAIEQLKKQCYSLEAKASYFSTSTVNSATLKSSGLAEETRKSEALGKELAVDNVGRKLMQLMGWAGGGLGNNAQGIQQPVSVSLRVGRDGLGHQTAGVNLNDFKTKARNYIKRWINGDHDQDLVFSSDYTSDERAAMHKIAASFSLKSKSYGKEDARHLVISKKLSPWKVVEELAACGGLSDKYELRAPSDT